MNVDEAMAYAKQLSGGSLNFSHHSNPRTLAIGALYNEVERLREENEWMGIAGQQMARHLAEAKAELAAAKAASVCPVEIAALGDADWEYSVGVKCKSDDDANKLFDWLWERLEERGEG